MKIFSVVVVAFATFVNISAQVNRTYDGSNNNQINVTWGSAGSHFNNFLETAYADKISEPGGKDRPNPRNISNKVFGQSNFIPSNRKLTDFAWSFGQFIDHDITFNNDNHDEDISINIPACDNAFDPYCKGEAIIPMRRSKSDPNTGTSVANPRKNINDISHFIDGSGVYGSDAITADWLRSKVDGKLKMSKGGFLPFNTIDGEFESETDPNAPFMLIEGEAPVRHFIAGDLRANEQPSLTSLHTLFLREHNRICDELKVIHPEFTDEELYQKARKMVGGTIQAITYNEWLPALGINTGDYVGYDENVNPSIMNVFSAAAFRLGHTLVNDQIIRLDENGDNYTYGTISLKEAFFNPMIVYEEGGVDPIFRGMASQMQQTFDTKVVDALRNFLFGLPGYGGLDLVSININRGRERGLPDYNSIREQFGLPKKNDFSDITVNEKLANSIKDIYNENINNIDPWVGMLSEDMMPGNAVGELISVILAKQFKNLRDGDRYFYLNDLGLTEEERQIIHTTKFSDVIMRNTEIAVMQDNVFFMSLEDSDEANVGIEMNGFENFRTINIQAFPNPVAKYFTISLNSLRNEQAQFVVSDLSGKVLMQEQLFIQSGKNEFNFELNDSFIDGVYIIRLISEDGEGNLKIVKR